MRRRDPACPTEPATVTSRALSSSETARMFSGSLVAIVTPMAPDGAIDFGVWERLLEWHLTHGTAGIVVGGTTGESATLEAPEIAELLRRARAHVRGRIPILAGAGLSGTAATVERVRRLGEAGPDAFLVVTPAYNRPTQEGLFRHFSAVAQAASVPIVLYNVPSRTAVDLLPETVARLAAVARICGIKEAVADIDRVRELVATCPAPFVVLSGDDATAREAVLAGAKGVISVTANVAPRAMADMIHAALRGNRAEAAQVDGRLAALHRDLFLEANPIPVKWALREMGLIGPGIRLPLTEFSAAHHAALRESLRRAGASR